MTLGKPAVAIVRGSMICPGLLSWEDLREGRSAVKHLPDDYPVRVGAPVPLEPEPPEDWPFPMMPRGLALAAAALDRLERDRQRRFGLVLGLPGLFSETDYVELTVAHRHDPEAMAAATGFCEETPLLWLGSRLGGTGPVLRIDSACATSNDALIAASRWLTAGLVSDVIVVCASAMLNPTGTALFRNLRALEESDDLEASRPFDLRRRGFVMGEGAAAAWLSTDPPGEVLGWLHGFGQSMNAESFTDLPDDQSAMLRACRHALGDLDRVAFVCAHGTATLSNDAAEAKLYRELFGEETDHIPVSSIKSMIGHTIGAAALIEALVCLEALREQVAPPTINLRQPDPACNLYLPTRAVEIRGDHALSSAFAFGGHNSVVLLSREGP